MASGTRKSTSCRLDWLRSERAKTLDELDQVGGYNSELDDEIHQVEFGNE